LHATVSVFPPKRVVRRHTMELKRVKDPAYVAEVCSQQFRIDQDKYTLAILNSTDGADFDLGRGMQKEVMFCGLPTEDINAIQAGLLKGKIYPERLELGTVATRVAVIDYLAHAKSKVPILMLEIGAETTHSDIVSAAGVVASRP